MKAGFFLSMFFLFVLSISLLCLKVVRNSDDISIKIKDTDDTYSMKASYNPANSVSVLRWINSSINSNNPQGAAGTHFDVNTKYIDVTTKLSDNTEFYIKESPGEIKIKLDKSRNSTVSYYRIKRMCEGIKAVLAGH